LRFFFAFRSAFNRSRRSSSFFGTATSRRASSSKAFPAPQLPEGQSSADNALHDQLESVPVPNLPFVESKDLFVQVAEQVEGCDVNIAAPDCSLEQRPEVFEAVRVDPAIDVGYRVVDPLVQVTRGEVGVGLVGKV
jgi:hypothetical protein